MPDSISDGEAADMRARLAALELRGSAMESRVNVHEQKCASRYLQIMALIGVSIAINLPGAWPHLLAVIEVLK